MCTIVHTRFQTVSTEIHCLCLFSSVRHAFGTTVTVIHNSLEVATDIHFDEGRKGLPLFSKPLADQKLQKGRSPADILPLFITDAVAVRF